MNALLTSPFDRGTLAGNHPVGATIVPTLREVLRNHLPKTPGLNADNRVILGDGISVTELVGLLNRLGLEPDRVFVGMESEVDLHKPTFAGRLRLLRARANLSQESLAKKINVPTGTVTQWETGRRTPNLKMAVKIVNALGTDLNAFADCDWGDENTEESDEK